MTTNPDRGIALISVLWVLGLLAVMAASFAATTRTETRLAYNYQENAKAEALADAGVHRAIYGLLDLNPETAWRPGDSVYTFSLGEGDVQIRIEDEDGKIDLNAASLELIAGLFIALGLPEADAQILAERIGDFRDEDSEPRPLGAEDDAYFHMGLPQGTSDRPFVTESELLRVLGITQSLYRQVRPYVTVHSGATGIDPFQAQRPVLEAVPGITPPFVEMLLRTGPEGTPLSLFDDQLFDAARYLMSSRELVYEIRALGRTAGGGRFLRSAVVEIDEDRKPPFIIYSWKREDSPKIHRPR